MAPKPNSFYFFMKEMQAKEARKGRNISMKQMPVYAHPIWQKMSLAEKEPYEEMRRNFRKNPKGGKLASDGTRVEDNLLEEEEKQRAINKMIQDVKRYCNSDCTTVEEFLESAPKKIFYFMSFNVLCHTDEGAYVPIEVGLIEYSLQYGIHRQYTKIIHPGQPPTGYAGKARENSDLTHEINVFGEDCSERRIDIVFEEIKSFICPAGNEEYPPVFCEVKYLPVVIGCIDWLCHRLRKENVFHVWDATFLLMELAAGAGEAFHSYSLASDLLNKTSFDYHPSTRCHFHEEKDNHHCALAYSKKLCYLLSDALSKLFNVELTEKHIPTRATEEKAYTVHLVKESKRSDDFTPVRLDRTENYYQNTKTEEIKTIPKAAVPRQPASICIAAEMNKLHLNITAATVPGHGIGRGIRRK